MSIQYCEKCDSYIDTDYELEHFDENAECYNYKPVKLKRKIINLTNQ